jgi:hypothetical protein
LGINHVVVVAKTAKHFTDIKQFVRSLDKDLGKYAQAYYDWLLTGRKGAPPKATGDNYPSWKYVRTVSYQLGLTKARALMAENGVTEEDYEKVRKGSKSDAAYKKGLDKLVREGGSGSKHHKSGGLLQKLKTGLKTLLPHHST